MSRAPRESRPACAFRAHRESRRLAGGIAHDFNNLSPASELPARSSSRSRRPPGALAIDAVRRTPSSRRGWGGNCSLRLAASIEPTEIDVTGVEGLRVLSGWSAIPPFEWRRPAAAALVAIDRRWSRCYEPGPHARDATPPGAHHHPHRDADDLRRGGRARAPRRRGSTSGAVRDTGCGMSSEVIGGPSSRSSPQAKVSGKKAPGLGLATPTAACRRAGLHALPASSARHAMTARCRLVVGALGLAAPVLRIPVPRSERVWW